MPGRSTGEVQGLRYAAGVFGKCVPYRFPFNLTSSLTIKTSTARRSARPELDWRISDALN
eukprot:5670585-Amphidinium_carterae.1